MRAHQRVRAAAGRCDAKGVGDVLRALVEGTGGNHEVIDSERMGSHVADRENGFCGKPERAPGAAAALPGS
ncbi:hypothetical protein GCM10011400_42810 [Paraburkholderia caffeinilytica]|uniref:Uncharacterized protein n=1 Tax=Paraburkholderia caffeinilytica TaxID=1761016 RepID=A0ABQ1N145_9BURK|nr:hypothetical protein GCM10011400_42810 [Paraburkholderia caffeinilytica]